MKRILLITVLSVFCTQIFGQTPEERQKIIQTYDQTKINNLKQVLIEKNLAEKQEVDDYIARTGVPRTIKLENGGVMKIRKILEWSTYLLFN